MYLSVITTMAVLMPLFGQELYWTQNIGSMMKAITITMAGAIIGPVLVFVQSSHDNVRRRLASCMVDTGVWLTAVASDRSGSGNGGSNGNGKGNGSDVKSITVQDVIKQTALIEADLMCCTLEPPWPMLTSQVGADFRLYGASLLQLQKLLGSANALSNCVPAATVGDLESETRGVVEEVAAGVAASLAAMAVCLGHMPLGGPCSGNEVGWRPLGDAFWGEYLALVADGYRAYVSRNGLEDGACQGIMDVLKGHGIKDHTSKSPLVSLASCESLVRECQALEQRVAKALDVVGSDDVGDEKDGKPTASLSASLSASASASTSASSRLRSTVNSPYVVALVNDLAQATSYVQCVARSLDLSISRSIAHSLAHSRSSLRACPGTRLGCCSSPAPGGRPSRSCAASGFAPGSSGRCSRAATSSST